MKRFYVYILQSEKDGLLYIGYTNNIERRFKQHENGESKATAPRRPLRLIFYEVYINKQDAQRREKYLKTTTGKKSLKLMLRETLKKEIN